MNWLSMMFFWVANQIGLAFLWIDEQAREAYRDTRDSLIRYAMFTASFVIVAALIGNISYQFRFETGEYVAYFLLSVNYALGGVVLLFTIVNALPLIIGARVGTSVISNLTSSASSAGRFSGFASSADQAYATASRIWWSIIVSLHAFALIMTVFPLYRSIPGFLICLGSALGIAYAVGAQEIGGPWYRRYMIGLLLLFILGVVVNLVNAILPGELSYRLSRVWIAFETTESAARHNNWIAVLWFIAIVSTLFSTALLVWKISQGKRSLPLKSFMLSVSLLLFMIFLGPRLIGAAQGESGTPGPYWVNTNDNFVAGEPYAFPGYYEVYVYGIDGKLHLFATPEAFRNYYGCEAHRSLMECRGIISMPSHVTRRDKILEGTVIPQPPRGKN